MKAPVAMHDARFSAARALVTRSYADQAVEVFASLLEHCIDRFGADHIESSILYYEYGNALLRAATAAAANQRQQNTLIAATKQSVPLNNQQIVQTDENNQRIGNSLDSTSTALQRRRAIAEAAQRRFNESTAVSSGVSKNEESEDIELNEKIPQDKINNVDNQNNISCDHIKGDDEESSDRTMHDEDVLLALEMMETSWSILDQESLSSHDTCKYHEWMVDQMPRVLTGLGDVLSILDRHADAADAYLQALEKRQEIFTGMDIANLDSLVKTTLKLTVEHQNQLIEYLVCRRKIVEVNVLIAEELVAATPLDTDVVTTETKRLLVRARDRVAYANGYYEAAREQLQETVLLLGQLKLKMPTSNQLEEEKENVCFAATLVMGIGTTLAAFEEEKQVESRNAKRIKS